jgi:hypothetical protein
MQVSRSYRTRDEIDYEVLWFLVSLGAAIILAAWLSLGLPTPRCAFRSLTGLPCPTCGATRAAWQFLHGHFLASLLFNPLAFVLYCMITAFDLYVLIVLIGRAPRLRFTDFTPGERTTIRYAIFVLVGANWIYLLLFQR